VPFNANDADQIHVGQNALVTLDGSFETLSGSVSKISNVETVLEGNMLVRNVTIKVKNPGAITSESFATAVVGAFACNSGANFEPVAEKTVTAKASGEVGKINYDEGAYIKSGAAIVTLTSSSIDTEISTAALSLKDAELSLETR
jgi:HlyD family secretion protein